MVHGHQVIYLHHAYGEREPHPNLDVWAQNFHSLQGEPANVTRADLE